MKTSHILVLGGLAGAIAVALMSSGGGNTSQMYDDGASLDFASDVQATGALSDSTSDTLRTLIAENKARDREYKILFEEFRTLKESKGGPSGDLQELQDQLELLKAQIAEVEVKQVSVELNSDSTVIDSGVEQGVVPVSVKPTVVPPQDSPDPVAVDFDKLVPNLMMPTLEIDGESSSVAVNQIVTPSSVAMTNYRWIDPVDVVVTTNREGMPVKTYPTTSVDLLEMDDADVETDTAEESEDDVPYMTVPAMSMFTDSVTLTAVIGRVPSAGTVVDPYRFKVMVGSRNLATNGYEIPNLESMVLSGVAKGDMTMRCASGVIDIATFTFRDGTVRTVQYSAEDPIGYIADKFGVPCVPGQYLTNAHEYIATKGAMATVGSMAEAFAAGEVTNIGEGASVTSVVTGDSLINGIGQGLGEGASQVGDWLDDRQQSAFDAVFIPVGKTLSVHIERAIEIDYEKEGRKILHIDEGGLF